MSANPAAVLQAPGQITIENRKIPQPGPGQVQVAIGAVGICGSDVHYYEHGRIGDFVLEAPMVIGHESAGTITALGQGVDPSRMGQLVALEPGVPCKTCAQCLAGRYNLCPDMRFFATPPVDGSIAKYVTIDAAFAHPAAGLTAEQAAMAEPVSVGVWACRKASVTVGDRVLVTGAGPVGLFAAQVARAYGASSVTLTDLSPFRLEVAAQLGFDTQRADEPLATDSCDVLLECSGAAPAFKAGMRALGRAGRAVVIGMGSAELPLEVFALQGKELTVQGVFRYRNCYPAALELIGTGAVKVAPVLTHRFTLEETEAALTLARREPNSLKPVVVP
ncbi:NAD(P)-dependent alcohol dehydrogenase [Nesterenkonia alkaliphila]|uniref:Alcohol dehydrogenase catalytic domain-containing protein n=1 Tax=Nesterenkonia alkaliphila TaxID=1463631 RepID=A0A7K1UFT3_9MICC|nr:NAD(P)-dependent alcohol dehydrogenase [Nesterenkonia alkaliphila]MVT24941.1 alcohol dehydrogenase catalytic domain-containing protein [Nesterenkonia alkaliphila]GFZ86838.1 sorbitol dehydrogenase [Nesterenkonia alkaliphila]